MKNNFLFKTVALAMSLALSIVAPASFSKKAEAVTQITPKVSNTYAEYAANQTTTTTISVPKGNTIVPVNLSSAGTFTVTATVPGLSGSISIYLYSDSACTQQVGSNIYLSRYGLSGSYTYSITSAHTYYLKFVSNNASATNVSIGTQFVKKQLTLSSSFKIFQNKEGSTLPSYHKFTIKKKKVVIIGGNEFSTYGTNGMSSISILLCKKNKTAIGENHYLSSSNSYQVSFVLPKGTYYVKTTTSYLSQLAVKTKAAKTAKTKAKKAKVIKKGKKAWGSLTVNDSTKKKQVFKIKINKKKVLKFQLANQYGEGSIHYEVKGPQKFLWGNTGYVSAHSKGTWKTTSKAKKGTYTTTITKSTYNSKGSAAFYIKPKS